MDININQGPQTSRIQAHGQAGRKLPSDFYAKRPELGKMGGLQPLPMVDSQSLENAWKDASATRSGDNIIRNARLCP